MTLEVLILLIILGVSLVLFSFEWVSADIVAMGVLLALILSGSLPVDQAFLGFGSDAVILITGLLILTAALVRTGVVDTAGNWLQRIPVGHPRQLLLLVMTAAAGLSSIMSNTAATAFFVPVVMGMARKMRISASRLLMPLAFASILASSVTLIGTSTNIVVSDILVQYGLAPMGVFELTPVGLPVLAVGLAYMYWIGRRLIPDRSIAPDLQQEFNLLPYLTQVFVLENSPWDGRTLEQTALGRDLDLVVLRVARDGENFLAPKADLVLNAGDTLTVEGSQESILKIKQAAQIGIEEFPPSLQEGELSLAEVIILPRSPLIHRRLVGVGLREQHGIQVLAINRHEATIHRRVGQTRLRMGDVLLVQGPRAELRQLEQNNIFRIISSKPDESHYLRRGRRTVVIFAGSILLATFNILSLPVAMLLGSLVAFLLHCITPEEAYRDVEWRVIVLIGCMLAFGRAMEYTGAAQYLASQIAGWSGMGNPVGLLSGFFWLTVLLTQPMSNQAAAVVVLPVAIQTASQLGFNPRSFAMMIAVAASTSFITPLEPACLLIYGLGRYRFIDFIRVGSLLTLGVFLIAVWLVPLVWPL